MFDFVSGMITMGWTVAGLFFLRFWTRTHEKLFLAFALAFWLLAANQALPAMFGVAREEWTWVYLLRLLAFLIIIAAVIAKNRGRA